ncbi:MAG: helix-turn-helix transcriptional regulator [Bacilli bacterium]|nr:helix-turn-helix transcriptional regulator [Bacilli bacterium]
MFLYEHRGISFAHKEGFSSSPKDEFEKHMHHFLEVIYFLKGDVEFHVEDDKRFLSPGDVVLIQPGQYHFADVNRGETYERYVLKVPEEELSSYLTSRLLHYPNFFSSCDSFLPLLQTLDQEFVEYDEEEFHDFCIAKITEFFLLLSKKSGNKKSEKIDPLVRKTIDYVEENLREHLSLESIAKALSYSPSRVSKAFSSEMHVSLMSYIRGKKIMGAHALIRQGMKAQDASFLMGFSDYSTFYRGYLKMLGEKPSSGKN